jgi:multidrug efflux pump subunit AcrA (membrane-fusion protein)
MKIRFPSAEEPKAVLGMIWVLNSRGQLEPRRVKLGITDGRETAVLDGDLKEGETVITGEINDDTGSQQRQGSQVRSPFAGPGGMRRGGR